MTKEIKYTTDGKKVVVINDLNQTEKIVQEIFVNEKGEEILQGEMFVAKNLLDEPAKSWKEKQLEQLELTYENDKAEWDSKIKNLNRDKRLVYNSLSARVKWLRNIAKEPREEEFKKVINLIADFLSDTEKWVFVKHYTGWFLERFNEDGCDNVLDRLDGYHENKNFDSMRLLSLFGKTNGSLVFRINDYSDGSGSDKNVEYFNSKESALRFMQKEIDKEKSYSEWTLKNAKKFDLILDPDKLKAYEDKRTSSVQSNIKELEDRLKILKEQL